VFLEGANEAVLQRAVVAVSVKPQDQDGMEISWP
jgi:hypothetical protein